MNRKKQNIVPLAEMIKKNNFVKPISEFKDISVVEDEIDKLPFVERKKPIAEIKTNIKYTLPKEDNENYEVIEKITPEYITRVEEKEVVEEKQANESKDEYENMVTDINKQTAIEKDIAINDNKTPSDLILSLNMLLDDKNIKGKTILDNRQVTAITLMNWAGQVYDIAFLREFVNEWCRYRISGDGGKGRADLISIAQALQLQHDKEREDYINLFKK